MGLFPLLRKMRSVQGPHMTCVQTAETYMKRYSIKFNETTFDIFLHRSIVFGHLRFLIYFFSGLFTLFAFVTLSLTFLVSYAMMQVFLRLQYKLTIFLILLGRRRFVFEEINKMCLFGLHIVMVLVGGFGWFFLLFIET